VAYDEDLPASEDKGEHTEEQTAHDASDLIGRHQRFEGIFGRFRYDLVAVEGDEGDFVPVEDPHQS
jgi:hypothetical protein